jgi:hypothetical protein
MNVLPPTDETEAGGRKVLRKLCTHCHNPEEHNQNFRNRGNVKFYGIFNKCNAGPRETGSFPNNTLGSTVEDQDRIRHW